MSSDTNHSSPPKEKSLARLERKTTSFADPEKPLDIRCRRTFTGHLSKIFSGQWLDNSKEFVSAAQDGKLIFWDACSGKKMHFVILKSPFVMSCGISSDASSVCVGGLENVCHVYRKGTDSVLTTTANHSGPCGEPDEENVTDLELVTEFKLAVSLVGHSGYISGCKFLEPDASKIVTSSGDKSVIMWDVNKNQKLESYPNLHSRDISSLSIAKQRGLLLTGSFDGSCCLLDPRVSDGPIMRYRHDSAEINCTSFSRSEDYFVTGSSDSTCKLYDTRWNESFVSSLTTVCNQEEVGTVALSTSGQYLFCSGESSSLFVWDLVNNAKITSLPGHSNRISFAELSPDGFGLLTGSWDSDLRLWTRYV